MSIYILGIESSCDDTSAAVIQDNTIISNVIAGQDVHIAYGGVVPELASRAHQQNIIPVVDRALKQAGIDKSQINGVAFTRGPGLLGALLVGTSFAKGFALASGIPLIEVNHLQAHVLALFLKEKNTEHTHPPFPFVCLLVSGGHTQLMVIHDYFNFETLGQTIDDAAGEAFDKCGKVMGLDYPSGPIIDKYAKLGNPMAFKFSKPRLKDFDFRFSGLKTSVLYFLRDKTAENPNFVPENLYDLCASLQFSIVNILMEKVRKAVEETGIKHVGIAGGVSANSGLREALQNHTLSHGWSVYVPPIRFTTDNAAMIAITGYFKYLEGDFAPLNMAPLARMPI